MPRVVCPDCEFTVRIRDDYDRDTVRCAKCGSEFHLPRGKKWKWGTAKPKGLAWIPAGVAAVVGALVVWLSFGSADAGTTALVIASVVLVTACIWGGFLVAEDGAYVGFDYLHLFDTMYGRLVIAPLLPLYILGYVIYLVLTIFQFATKRPRAYMPTVLFQVVGLLILVGVPIASASRRSAAEKQRQEERVAREEEYKKAKAAEVPEVSGDEEIDKALLDLESKEGTRSRSAVAALTKATPSDKTRDPVAKHLIKLASKGEADVVVAALAVMPAWIKTTPKEVLALTPLLTKQTTAPATKTALLKLFGDLPPDKRTIAPVVNAVRDPTLSPTAVAILKKMGSIAEKEVLSLAYEDDQRVKLDMISVLREIGTEQSRPELRKLANQPWAKSAQDALSAIDARSKK